MKEEKLNWYAIHTFNCKEMAIRDYLRERGLTSFVPMAYTRKIGGDNDGKRILKPVIHNYLFVQKTKSESELNQIISECPIPLKVMKIEGTQDYYQISESEMAEFRLLCDPQFKDSVFMESGEAEAKPGKEVVIIHGPFKGIRGKICRSHNNYYFVKILAGVGVMIQISRWYCKPV